MKCKELQISDWIADNNGFQWQIIGVGVDYATFEDNEGDCWEFNDKDCLLYPIPITPEILEKNGWHFGLIPFEKDLNENCHMSINKHWCYVDTDIDISLFFSTELEMGKLEVHNHSLKRYLEFVLRDALYVHELQHILKIAGMNELADNFKL